MRLFILLLLTTTMVNAQGLLEDFEDNRFVNYSFVSGVLNDAITNPDMSGANTSSKCAEYIRGKKIEDTQITSSYKIKNKGLVLIHVSYSSGKTELIKYLNL